MARLPRIDVPGLPRHIVVRGNNRADVFLDDTDRFVYLKALADALKLHDCELHAYVLMTNHVHLLVTSHEFGSASAVMQSVGRRFVRFVNSRRKRTGTLFEGRFKASLVESERYLLACMRYIESNPVRAGMASQPGDYAWSSFRSNACGDPGGIPIPHAVYLGLGSDAQRRPGAPRSGHAAWRAAHLQGVGLASNLTP